MARTAQAHAKPRGTVNRVPIIRRVRMRSSQNGMIRLKLSLDDNNDDDDDVAVSDGMKKRARGVRFRRRCRRRAVLLSRGQ